jgi:lysophospholipase L1-like esterase
MNQPNPTDNPSQSFPQHRPLAVGKVLRILGRDICLILLGCGIIEGFLQVTGGGTGRPQLFDADFTGGKPYAVNGQGLRGPEVPRDKQPGELRMLGLGDSTTFGTGVGWEETWPTQCAKELTATLRHEVRGINAGIPATSLKDMGYAMDHAWGDLHPDVVVLVVSGNLMSLSWIRREETGGMPAHELPPSGSLAYKIKTAINRQFRYLRLPGLLMQMSERASYFIGLSNHAINPDAPYGPMLAHGWRQPGLDPALVDQAWNLFERDLGVLRDRVRARGAHFYVASLPARFMLSKKLSDNEKAVPLHRLSVVPGARVLEICRRLAVDAIDLTESLGEAAAARGESLYNPLDYTHLSPYGHRIAAGAIAKLMLRDLNLNQAKTLPAVEPRSHDEIFPSP